LNKINFDTRTVIDIVSLNDNLKRKLFDVIDAELLLFNYTHDVERDEDEFALAIAPLLKRYIETFFKGDFKKSDLFIIRKTINLKNVDYKQLIDNITKLS
jgi:hypothetical protein